MNIKTLYFSPTGNTKKVVNKIAEGILKGFTDRVDKKMTDEMNNGIDHSITGEMVHRTTKLMQKKDLTTPSGRKILPNYMKDDLVVVGIPVYGGRIPQIILPLLEELEGNKATAVAVVSYGVRAYDDALLELRDLLEKKQFNVIGAAAVIGEHSFTRKVGTDRPNANDLEQCNLYGRKIAEKYLKSQKDWSEFFTQESLHEDVIKMDKNTFSLENMKGNDPYLPYSAPFITENLVTTDACTKCGICSNLCPTGAISSTDQKIIKLDQCIRCHACIKNCPVMAKYFQDSRIEKSKRWLEDNCNIYKENEFYL